MHGLCSLKKNANKQQPGLWLFVQFSAWVTILRVAICLCWMGVVLNVQTWAHGLCSLKKNANKQQPGLWLFVQVSAWLTILRVGIRMCWMGVVLNVQGVNLNAWFVFSLFQTYLSVWQGDADVQGTGKWWSCRGDMLLWFCYGSCPRDEWSTLPSTTCVAVADRHDFDRVSFSFFFY